jgi:hypothetical protein
MPELWTPGSEGPHEVFVDRLLRRVAEFAERAGVEKAVVEIELADTSRFVLDSITPEPGFGFVTLRPVAGDDDDAPEELIVPIASIRRIELRRAEEARLHFGFTLPDGGGESPGASTSK